MQILTFEEEEAGQSSPAPRPPPLSLSLHHFPSVVPPAHTELQPLQEPIYREKTANYRNRLAFGFIFIH